MNSILSAILWAFFVYLALIAAAALVSKMSTSKGLWSTTPNIQRLESKTLVSAWTTFEDAITNYLQAVSELSKKSKLLVSILARTDLPQYWHTYRANHPSQFRFEHVKAAHAVDKSADVVVIVDYDGYSTGTMGMLSTLAGDMDVLSKLSSKYVMVDLTLQPYINEGEISVFNTGFVGGTSVFNGESNGSGKTVIGTAIDDLHAKLGERATSDWTKQDQKKTAEEIDKLRTKLQRIAAEKNHHRIPVYSSVMLPCNLTGNLKRHIPSTCFIDKTSKCQIVVDWRTVDDKCRTLISGAIPNIV